MTINYDGRTFGSVANTPTGEMDGRTLCRYRQEGDVVWTTCAGGSIRCGTPRAQVNGQDQLDMRYQHLNSGGEWRAGRSTSVPDGRIRLHDRWQWTSGDHSAGESIIEER